MIKITLQAAIKILTEKNFRFVIEKCDKWHDKVVFQFVAANGYPINNPFVRMSDEPSKINAAILQNKANVLMLYDTKEQTIIGTCVEWYNIFKKLRDSQKKLSQSAM